MNTRILAGMVALLMAASGCAGPYQERYVGASVRSPGAAVGVSYFYDELAPYGRWLEIPPYGWCWTPYDVSPDWRPYTNGYWVYTEYGWTWASYEPWGWGVYHYGRWAFDPGCGWVWVPGTVWAPAWVAWRASDEWVGWAPLPPSSSWDASVGLRFGGADAIPPQHWCFVPAAHLVDASLRLHAASIAHNVTLLARTRDATRYEMSNGRPVVQGVAVGVIERVAGRKVPRLKLVDADSPGRGRGQLAGGGAVAFFRPTVRETEPGAPPAVRAAEEPTIPEPVLEQRREKERRKLEQSLAQDRARLEREHERELRSVPANDAIDEVRKRQAAEKQALAEQAVQERQVLEQRLQKKIVKPGRPKGHGEPGQKGKGREKGGHGGG